MQQKHRNRELWLAILAIILITGIYAALVVRWKGFPAARGLFGHSIGIVGFLLMLMTETLYSLRKRSRLARWGRMSAWLQFHIFTGLVGPYMVLLHTSWKYNGLAGVLMLMTIIVVVSGFVGRYIYTAIPRTVDGVEIEADELERRLAVLESEIQTQADDQSQRRKQLIRQQKTLRRQVDSLATARRLMSVWHAIHIPIGMALFSVAIIHIIGAVYYATLIR